MRVFSKREQACEFVSLFVVCMAMAADVSVADAAVQMIELLRRRFLNT